MTSGVLRVAFAAGLVAATIASAPALAQRRGGEDHHDEGERPRGDRGAHVVPEFDPAATGAVAAIVVGGGVLLARRRKSR